MTTWALPVPEQELPELTSDDSLSSHPQDGDISSNGNLHHCQTIYPTQSLKQWKERAHKETEQLMRSMRNSQGGVSTCEAMVMQMWVWPAEVIPDQRNPSPGWGFSDGHLSHPWPKCLCDHSRPLKEGPGVDPQISAKSDKLNLFSDFWDDFSDFWFHINFPYLSLNRA